MNDNDTLNNFAFDGDLLSSNDNTDYYLTNAGSVKEEDLFPLENFQIQGNMDPLQDMGLVAADLFLDTPQNMQTNSSLFDQAQEEDTTKNDQERLMKDLSNFKPHEFIVNIDILKNTYLFASRMGVVISHDVPNISYVSESLCKKLGFAQPDQIKSYYDIFIPLHINWSIQSIKEDRQKRAEFMATNDNGAEILRSQHLKTEHKGRALLIDKFGSVQELAHKCFRIYSSSNPAKVDVVYTFLFW